MLGIRTVAFLSTVTGIVVIPPAVIAVKLITPTILVFVVPIIISIVIIPMPIALIIILIVVAVVPVVPVVVLVILVVAVVTPSATPSAPSPATTSNLGHFPLNDLLLGFYETESVTAMDSRILGSVVAILKRRIEHQCCLNCD